MIFAKEPRGRDITVNAIAPGPPAEATVPPRQGRRDRRAARVESPLEWLGGERPQRRPPLDRDAADQGSGGADGVDVIEDWQTVEFEPKQRFGWGAERSRGPTGRVQIERT